MKREKYRDLYLQEAEELFSEMNSQLLLLEKNPGDGDALNAIFRAAHTLKTMSASMGFSNISTLAHRMEDVLDSLRSGGIDASEDVVELLFKSFDSLENMNMDVRETGADTVEAKEIMCLLEGVLRGRKGKTSSKKGKKPAKETGADLGIRDRNVLARIRVEGLFCYHVRVTIAEGCALKGVRALLVFKELGEIGEIVRSVPESGALEEEKFDRSFDCVFVSREGKKTIADKVSRILDIESVEVNKIQPGVPDSKSPASLPTEVGQAKNPAENVHRIQSVRVDIARLDRMMDFVEEMVTGKLRLFEIGSRIANPELTASMGQFSRLTQGLQMEVMGARLVPVGRIFERFPRLVRDLARKEGKKVRFELAGSDVEVDRTVLDEIGDPVIHLLKNAVDHGLETAEERMRNGKSEEGSLILSARREKSYVFIEIEDDGRGMDAAAISETALERGLVTDEDLKSMSEEEILELTFRPGFSVKKKVTEISGRGVGLDVVKDKAEQLGGRMLVRSSPGEGTKISICLPITTAVVQAVLVDIAGSVYAVPVSGIAEIIVVANADIKRAENQETVLYRDRVLPVFRAERIFFRAGGGQLDGDGTKTSSTRMAAPQHTRVLVVEFGGKQFGITVDRLIRQQEIVIRELPGELKGIRGFAGGTILGDGSVALVLDVANLL